MGVRSDWRVLVPRPRAQADELAAALTKNGWPGWALPLFDFVEGPDYAGFADFVAACGVQDYYVWVSQTAVTFGYRALASVWPAGQHLAVGQATAQQGRQLGLEMAWPERQDSEGMWQWLQPRLPAAGKVILCRGVSGRDWLIHRLKAEKVSVYIQRLYDRQAIVYRQNDLYDQWQAKQINCIVATSVAHVQQLFRLFPVSLHPAMRQCLWLVFSDRIGRFLQQQGCRRIALCQQPGQQAIVDLLTRLSRDDYD